MQDISVETRETGGEIYGLRVGGGALLFSDSGAAAHLNVGGRELLLSGDALQKGAYVPLSPGEEIAYPGGEKALRGGIIKAETRALFLNLLLPTCFLPAFLLRGRELYLCGKLPEGRAALGGRLPLNPSDGDALIEIQDGARQVRLGRFPGCAHLYLRFFSARGTLAMRVY